MPENVSLHIRKNLSVRTKLGKKIRRLRQQRGWSRSVLASSCGVHTTHLGKIERGAANARLSTLLSIAKSLQVTVASLLQAID